MSEAVDLPAGFEALLPFVAHWAKPTRQARLEARLVSSDAALEAFYQAGLPLLEPALAYLDARPDDSDPRNQRLMLMVLALVQAALAVERLGDQEQGHQVSHRYFRYS
ncbi:MAG: hypothetical protein ABW039_07105 [Sphingobium sp.]